MDVRLNTPKYLQVLNKFSELSKIAEISSKDRNKIGANEVKIFALFSSV